MSEGGVVGGKYGEGRRAGTEEGAGGEVEGQGHGGVAGI